MPRIFKLAFFQRNITIVRKAPVYGRIHYVLTHQGTKSGFLEGDLPYTLPEKSKKHTKTSLFARSSPSFFCVCFLFSGRSHCSESQKSGSPDVQNHVSDIFWCKHFPKG